MRQLGLTALIFLAVIALIVACGTAKGRYDGESLDGDDDGAPGPSGDDDATDDDAVDPEIDNYTWVDADGNEVSLYDYLGKVVLLNTAASWCVPCREETPSLRDDIWRTFKDEDFVIIQLIVEDSNYNGATAATAAAWREEFGLDYVVCADPDWTLRPYFLSEVIPFNMLLTRDFQIELMTHEYDKDVLSLLIEDLL